MTQPLRSEILRKVAELGELEPAQVAEDKPLKELGIDSLMTIELVVFIERMLERQVRVRAVLVVGQFPEERMGSIRTCNDIFREIESMLRPAS